MPTHKNSCCRHPASEPLLDQEYCGPSSRGPRAGAPPAGAGQGGGGGQEEEVLLKGGEGGNSCGGTFSLLSMFLDNIMNI